jgi:indolepyruvate ferredoxin oxidoreductase beta subunit
METGKESYNLIIAGVGGQGNVLASQLIGQVFIRKGYFVTIGETYGASQRGGAVMSHIRISKRKQLSPLIPKGKADVLMALEPVEAIRVLIPYGSPDVVALVNTRPLYPVDVTAGEATYPEIEEIKGCLENLSRKVYFIDATEKAVQMGLPILGNMIMIGALIELGLLPFNYEDFCDILSTNFDKKELALNIQAIGEGRKAAQRLASGS